MWLIVVETMGKSPMWLIVVETMGKKYDGA
jgi:hypothetical protein